MKHHIHAAIRSGYLPQSSAPVSGVIDKISLCNDGPVDFVIKWGNHNHEICCYGNTEIFEVWCGDYVEFRVVRPTADINHSDIYGWSGIGWISFERVMRTKTVHETIWPGPAPKTWVEKLFGW